MDKSPFLILHPAMDFKQLRAFLAVARMGNVTRAAEALHLVQPAVTRQLQLLEEDMGIALFRRARRGMVLTEGGQTLVGYAERAMLELERARAEISESGERVGGLASLGLLPSTCDVLASATVAAMRTAFPGVRLRIVAGYGGTLRQWLEAGEVDVALVYKSSHPPAIRTTPLVEEPLWVVGPASARLRRRKPVPLASLVGQPLILPSAPHGIRSLVDHACGAAKIKLTIVAETNAMSVQKSLVLGGHGLTLLPAVAVADDIRRGQLTAAPVSDPAISRIIELALPTNRAIRRHVQCAADTLVQTTRQAIASGDWPEARWLQP